MQKKEGIHLASFPTTFLALPLYIKTQTTVPFCLLLGGWSIAKPELFHPTFKPSPAQASHHPMHNALYNRWSFLEVDKCNINIPVAALGYTYWCSIFTTNLLLCLFFLCFFGTAQVAGAGQAWSSRRRAVRVACGDLFTLILTSRAEVCTRVVVLGVRLVASHRIISLPRPYLGSVRGICFVLVHKCA